MSDVIASMASEKSISAHAWRVEFHETTDDSTTGAIEVTEPRHLFGKLCPMDAPDFLGAASPESPKSFVIVWIPPGAQASVSFERDAELWLRGGEVVGKRGVVRAGVRTVRIFWTFNRALIYATAENINSALNAVVRFTVAQREMIELEDEIATIWPEIDADASPTHTITARQQRRRSQVNELTVRTIRMQIKLLRITQALEQLDPSLDESSKRIYAELVLAGALYERLELLEDPVEFALEHYETANTRLSEARVALEGRRHAAIDHLLEATIVLLLLYPLHLFW